MPSYVITGVSRGIGVSLHLPAQLQHCFIDVTQYGFLGLLSEKPDNIVIGLVRDKPATDKKISEDPKLKDRSNIHILQGDLTNYDELKVCTYY